MPNMSYCRFRNTLGDLEDCYDTMMNGEDGDLNESEERARKQLIEMCLDIATEYGSEIGYDVEYDKVD